MNLYKKSTYEIAKDILNTITKKTGLYATAGIGPNMLLAKIAMDIEAKHNSDMIAEWTYNDVKETDWFRSDVMWATAEGWFVGTGNDCFSPQMSQSLDYNFSPMKTSLSMYFQTAKGTPLLCAITRS